MRRDRGRPVDLAGRVDAVRRAVEVGGARLGPVAVSRAHEVLGRADERLRLGAEHTVVALAGATGSGKSSLFNALAGLELATVGARRPTTSSPAACVWGDGADALLDWLEVPNRHRTSRESALDAQDQADLHGLVLLDLPDHDSTHVTHRLEVDRLVGLVDLLVWVVDPQKYADDALHHGYLRRLVGHEGVMLVVLNQVDRVPASEVGAVVTDLQRLLAEDGLAGVRVVTTSARTGDGVHELRSALVTAVQTRDAALRRLAADLDAVAAALAEGVGTREADPDRIDGSDQLVTALAGAAGVPAVLDAVEAHYRRGARGSVGWPFTRWSRSLRPDPLKRLRLGEATGDLQRLGRSSLPEPTPAQRAEVELAARRVAESASAGLPPRWADAVRDAAAPPDEDLADALDQAVTGVELEHRRPVWWRLVGALQLVLALAAVAGGAWLVALAVVAWLQLPEPPMVAVGEVPLPTLLLLGGLAAGLLVALVGGRLARWGARRRRRRTERRLREAVEGVARDRVLGPVAEVLRAHRTVRQTLGR
ncbi:MAG: GTP-binding protein [Actinomycetes bacterium]